METFMRGHRGHRDPTHVKLWLKHQSWYVWTSMSPPTPWWWSADGAGGRWWFWLACSWWRLPVVHLCTKSSAKWWCNMRWEEKPMKEASPWSARLQMFNCFNMPKVFWNFISRTLNLEPLLQEDFQIWQDNKQKTKTYTITLASSPFQACRSWSPLKASGMFLITAFCHALKKTMHLQTTATQW